MPGYLYQEKTIEHSSDKQENQSTDIEHHSTVLPASGSNSSLPPLQKNENKNRDSSFLAPIFSTFLNELSNQWWNILVEKWQADLSFLYLSAKELDEIRSILSDTSSPLLLRISKLEEIIEQLDTESDRTFKIQEMLSFLRQIILATEHIKKNTWNVDLILSTFHLANKVIDNDYFKTTIGNESHNNWKSRIELAERSALLFSDLSRQSSNNPIGYIETLFESGFSPAGINEIITKMRVLFEHLDLYYKTQISRQTTSVEISTLGKYLVAYEQEKSIHKKFIILIELILDGDVFDSVEPIIEQIFPDLTLGLRLAEIIRDKLSELPQSESAGASEMLTAFSLLDSDFRSKIHQEITSTNSAVGNVVDSMLTRSEHFLNLDGMAAKLISAFFQFKSNKITWKEFSSAIFSSSGFDSAWVKERLSIFVASKTNSARETVDNIISKITNIDYNQILNTSLQDYPKLFMAAIYNELPDIKSTLYYVAAKIPYAEDIRIAIESINQIIKNGDTRWYQILLQKISNYAQESVFYKLAVVFINAGLAGMMWRACSDVGGLEMRQKNIKEAQLFLSSALRYLPAHGFENIRELANWLPILHSIRENIKDVPDIENGNIMSWSKIILDRLEDPHFSDNVKISTLKNDIQERLRHWTTTLSNRLAVSVNIDLDEAAGSSDPKPNVAHTLNEDTQSMSSASARSMSIQSEMGNLTAVNRAGYSWGTKAAIATAATAVGAGIAYKLIKHDGKNSIEINPEEFTDEQLNEEKSSIKKSLGQAQSRLKITKGITIGSGVISSVALAIAAIIRAKKIHSQLQSKSTSTQPQEDRTTRPRRWLFDTDERYQRVYNWDTLSIPKAQQSFISEKWSNIQKNEKILWFTGLGMLIPMGIAGWKWYDYAQQIQQLEEKLSAIEIEEIKRKEIESETVKHNRKKRAIPHTSLANVARYIKKQRKLQPYLDDYDLVSSYISKHEIDIPELSHSDEHPRLNNFSLATVDLIANEDVTAGFDRGAYHLATLDNLSEDARHVTEKRRETPIERKIYDDYHWYKELLTGYGKGMKNNIPLILSEMRKITAELYATQKNDSSSFKYREGLRVQLHHLKNILGNRVNINFRKLYVSKYEDDYAADLVDYSVNTDPDTPPRYRRDYGAAYQARVSMLAYSLYICGISSVADYRNSPISKKNIDGDNIMNKRDIYEYLLGKMKIFLTTTNNRIIQEVSQHFYYSLAVSGGIIRQDERYNITESVKKPLRDFTMRDKVQSLAYYLNKPVDLRDTTRKSNLGKLLNFISMFLFFDMLVGGAAGAVAKLEGAAAIGGREVSLIAETEATGAAEATATEATAETEASVIAEETEEVESSLSEQKPLAGGNTNLRGKAPGNEKLVKPKREDFPDDDSFKAAKKEYLKKRVQLDGNLQTMRAESARTKIEALDRQRFIATNEESNNIVTVTTAEGDRAKTLVLSAHGWAEEQYLDLDFKGISEGKNIIFLGPDKEILLEAPEELGKTSTESLISPNKYPEIHTLVNSKGIKVLSQERTLASGEVGVVKNYKVKYYEKTPDIEYTAAVKRNRIELEADNNIKVDFARIDPNAGEQNLSKIIAMTRRGKLLEGYDNIIFYACREYKKAGKIVGNISSGYEIKFTSTPLPEQIRKVRNTSPGTNSSENISFDGFIITNKYTVKIDKSSENQSPKYSITVKTVGALPYKNK